ncbi:MAG: hypothetical protein K2G03_03755 [Bacilli bacterium]|nr:hypothetical protein [Bacilli bacterium]
MMINIIIYGYYIFIFMSIVATLIYDRKYEKYKREKGYKNNYQGTYKLKDFYNGHAFKNLFELFKVFFLPIVQLEPIIDLAMFKNSARVYFNREKFDNAILWQDPRIIDVDFKIISEEKNDNLAIRDEDRKDLNMENINGNIESLDRTLGDRQKEGYLEVIDEYFMLYGQYFDKNIVECEKNVSIGEENGERHLK